MNATVRTGESLSGTIVVTGIRRRTVVRGSPYLWLVLLALLALMPIVPQAFGLRVGGFPLLITLQRCILYPLVGMWFIRKLSGETWRRPPLLLSCVVIFYFTVRLVSIAFSPDPFAALGRASADVIEYFLLFLLIADYIDAERLRTVLMTWSVLSIPCFLLGVFELLTDWNFVENYAFAPELVFWTATDLGHGFQRAFSLFDHPISFSWVSGIFLLSAVTLLTNEKKKVALIVLICSAIASCGSIYLSFSRSAVIALAGTFLVLSIPLFSRKRGRVIILAVIACIAIGSIVVAAYPELLADRMATITAISGFRTEKGDAGGAVKGRVDLFWNGLALSARRPFGYGYTATSRNLDSSFHTRTFHGMYGFENHYVVTLIETGLVGMLSLILILGWSLIKPLRDSAVNASGLCRRLGLFFLAVAVFYPIIFNGTTWLGNQEQMYWAIVGMAGGFYSGITCGKTVLRLVDHSRQFQDP